MSLLYDDITRKWYLKPRVITDGVILLRELGIKKIYNFYAEPPSNINITKNFFLFRHPDSELVLAYNKNALLVFEENGKTVYKPEKITYYCYGNTQIYYIHPRNVYHIYYEGVKLITPNGEIVINQAKPKNG